VETNFENTKNICSELKENNAAFHDPNALGFGQKGSEVEFQLRELLDSEIIRNFQLKFSTL